MKPLYTKLYNVDIFKNKTERDFARKTFNKMFNGNEDGLRLRIKTQQGNNKYYIVNYKNENVLELNERLYRSLQRAVIKNRKI